MNCSHCCAETKRLSITAASGATDWASKLQRGLQIVVTEEDPSQVSSSDSESYQKRSLKTERCCKEHACARFGMQVLSISQGGKSPGTGYESLFCVYLCCYYQSHSGARVGAASEPAGRQEL